MRRRYCEGTLKCSQISGLYVVTYAKNTVSAMESRLTWREMGLKTSRNTLELKGSSNSMHILQWKTRSAWVNWW